MAGEVFIFGSGGSGGSGGGGGSELTVVGGTVKPVKVSHNTIWVDTDVDITTLAFSAEEPNTYEFKCDKLNGGADDAHGILVPFQLKAGDVLNFTIPVTTTGVFEAVRLKDSAGKEYCIRHENGTAVSEWTAGTKITVVISDTVHQVGSWGNDGSAYIIKWGNYNHEEGMVWVAISNYAPNKIASPLGDDWIEIYPISAKQRINDAWINKNMMLYQNGQWVDRVFYLYNKGIKYIDEHGMTWSAANYHTDGGDYLMAGKTSSGASYSGTWTSGFFDASNFSTLEVYVDKYHRGGTESYGKILVIDEAGNTLVSHAYSAGQTDVWALLDISRVTNKKCRVSVTSGHSRTASGQLAYLTFSIVRCY